MAIASLSAAARAESGKGASRANRREGRVPAIIYGHKRAPQSLTINAKELGRLLERIAAEATVIELNVDGATSRTLIREIQRHPFRKQILHVDFQELVAGEKVTVRIPIRLTGSSEGVRLAGGIMDQTLRDLEIRVDPALIPNHIDVDVGALTIGHSIHVSEISLAEGIEVLTDGDATVCVCAIPKAVVEATPAAVEGAAAEAPAEPELIRKAKPDDEEAVEEKK
ncbi:MAG: 50S ribosomal protein L25/general stress protein Ctc [Gemmatimonadetes bacterium]|nr:50S ribosomal protein L25/general stress protein Ctc [Gemmatimonadota bacterium]